MRRTGTVVVAAVAGLAVLAGCASRPVRLDGAAEPAGVVQSSPGGGAVPSAAAPVSPPVSVSPSKPVRASRSAKPSRSPTPEVKLVLGPKGLSNLRLGMSVNEAFKTGDLAGKPPETAPTCDDVFLVVQPNGAARAWVEFTGKFGLTRIEAQYGLATPEGIKLGSTSDEVVAAYPDWDRSGDGKAEFRSAWARVPGQPAGTYYAIDVHDNRVTSLDLRLADAC
jgi:hypothetical protein